MAQPRLKPLNNRIGNIVIKPETLHDVKNRLTKNILNDESTSADTPSEDNSSSSIESSPIISTKKVHIIDQPSEDNDINQDNPILSLSPIQLTLNQSGASSDNARLITTDSFTEVIHENDSGLSWGEKRSNDMTWEETWVQQQITRREPGLLLGHLRDMNVIFGRSSGINGELHQRWTATWETKTPQTDSTTADVKRIVKKCVRQYDPDMNTLIEEWNEIIEETCDSSTVNNIIEEPLQRHVLFTMIGKTISTDRQWKKIRHQVYHVIKDQEDQLIEETEEFDEIIDGQIYQYKKKKDQLIDKIETHTIVPNTDQHIHLLDPIDDASYHITNGTMTETSSNGVVYNKRWDTSVADLPNRFIETKQFEDEWWTEPDGNTWGYKKLTIKINQENDDFPSKNLLLDHDIQEITQNNGNQHHISTEIIEEKWYDNTKEKVIDKWRTFLKYDQETNSESSKIIQKIQSGNKTGNSYITNNVWGESWNKTSIKKDYMKSSNKVDSTTTHNEADDVVISESYDKWWIEPSGNKWGEKKYVNCETQAEFHEKWYNNGREEQVDRWEITPDGRKIGKKFGHNETCEWKEAWEADNEPTSMSSNHFWMTKHWKESENHSSIFEWGEMSGQEGGHCWKNNYGERKNPHTNSGTKWINKWHDDGLGNFETHKEGSSWEESNIVNWYSDRFGECLGQQEKWAMKQGHNNNGDVWLEKWNEFPNENKAEKIGSNKSFGDEWSEAWYERKIDEKKFTWAEKKGKNRNGEEWIETWEENDLLNKKAKKFGKNNYETWQEEWGEDLSPDGSGEKWTSKWAENHFNHTKNGKSWGDRWGKDGVGGHHWGEIWENDTIQKWSNDTPGRPDGC